MTRPSIEIAREIVAENVRWIEDGPIQPEWKVDIAILQHRIAAAIDQRDKEWGELVAGLREAAEINPRDIMKAFYAGDLGHREQVCDEVVLDIIHRTLKACDQCATRDPSGVSEAPSDRVEYAHNILTDCIVDPPRAAGKQAWPSEEEQIEALAKNLVGLDKTTVKTIGIGWVMAINWLKARMEGK